MIVVDPPTDTVAGVNSNSVIAGAGFTVNWVTPEVAVAAAESFTETVTEKTVDREEFPVGRQVTEPLSWSAHPATELGETDQR